MSTSSPSTSHPPPSSANRLRLHPTPTSASNATRNSIINSSAKGWSPLQISKRDSVTSPLKPSPHPSPDPSHDAASPRRSSNSFKHVTRNSLVSNSPFKSPTTVQGQQAAGIYVDEVKEQIIHERRSAVGLGARALGQSPEKAQGVANTPKAAIGLGISAARPRSASRTPSAGSGSAVAGTRKVSTERGKVAFPTIAGERKPSGSAERKVSGSKENDSPDVKAGKRLPRASMGLKGLAKNEYVSKSPFLSSSKRIPSGELRGGSPSGPSPKTIPVERDDVFGSPSPRRVSAGKRRASPSSKTLGSSTGGNSSPTPSPPRAVTNLVPSAGPSPGPSPLSQPSTTALIRNQSTPTPTPTRSSMTPSRRLRGPRDLSETNNESPSKPKTVTFQSVPDVKEFEPHSVEGSADGSFEVTSEHWNDNADTSLDDMLETTGDDSIGSIDSLSRLRITNPDMSPSPEPVEGELGDESTTADFVNTLIEEGLFSPPQVQTPAFEDPPGFTIPLEDDKPPVLSTPSLGGSVHATPLLAGSAFETTHLPEQDPAGIPYGRSHHFERAVEAHSHVSLEASIKQSNIPHNADHQMLLNGNVSKPSLQYSTPFDTAPITAHQVGAMPDPFITIQTATKVLAAARSRSEDGVPLGRTSHAERVQAARMLATQSLGLGMPRSPAVSNDLQDVPKFPVQATGGQSREGPRELEEDMEVLFDVSFEDKRPSEPVQTGLSGGEAVERQTTVTPRKAFQPPAPQQLDLPSPVTSPSHDDPRQEEQPKLAPKPFSLPNIGFTSPFFNTSATMPTPSAPSDNGSGDSTDGERPLTPPPAVGQEKKSDSPHRIPSFEFEEISLQAVDSAPRQTAKVVSPVKAASASTSGISNMTTSASQSSNKSISSSTGDFGIGSGSSDSTTSRVRQRISREMIRDTINQRIADGSITRRGSTQGLMGSSSSGFSVSPAPRPISIAHAPQTPSKDKALPSPPIEKAAPMLKSLTTDTNAANRKVSGNMEAGRPGMRPRSQTQSAHEVLRAAQKDGVIGEPRSALDRLMDIAPVELGTSIGTASTGSTTPSQPILKQNPVSILLPPKPASGIPVITARSPTPTGPGGMREREVAINAKRREKDGRSASGDTMLSSGSGRGRRRSMSTGDVGDEAGTVKGLRQGKNPRLTLGIDQDGVSMLDAFQEEAAHIGQDRGYKIRERKVVQATYGQIGHGQAGDINGGKAWRTLRRPSDMNEHAAEIRAMRVKEASAGKSSGTIFVKVLGVEGLSVPVPDEPTYFCVTLDNGIDYIRTPYSVLVDGAKVNQEFSLVEHPNFEFSLSLDVRRDPHILKLIHEKLNPAPVRALGPPGKTSSGFRGLFGSPRKPKGARGDGRDSRSSTPQPTSTPTSAPIRGTIASYIPTPSSSTIAKTHVAFKPIAKNCEAKVLEIRYPMFAMFKNESDRPTTPSTHSSTHGRKQIAKITLQIFRLPPLPGLGPEDLPTCIDECLRGIRHHAWHECEYHEGILTQEGGDCTHPKRRMFKLIGGNLVAINEVTKKQVTSIDLRKAKVVLDLNVDEGAGSPLSKMTMRRNSEEAWSARPRSFRIGFDEEAKEGIDFWADKQEDKDVWISTLNGLLGKIPSNPLWAELLAAKQRERVAKRSASSGSLAKEARRASQATGMGVRPKSVALPGK